MSSFEEMNKSGINNVSMISIGEKTHFLQQTNSHRVVNISFFERHNGSFILP